MLALVALTLLSAVRAGPHGVVHRRHHARHLPAGMEDLNERFNETLSGKFKRDCELGAWQCVGDELQRCDHNAWISIQHCTGENIICSADSRATGCIWSWSLGDPNKSPVTVVGLPPISSAATGPANNGPPASSVPNPSIPVPPTPATTPATTLATTPATIPVTIPATAPAPATTAAQSGTVIGGNLMAGGKEANEGNPPPEDKDSPGPITKTWKNAGLAPTSNPTGAQSVPQPAGVSGASSMPIPNGSPSASASAQTAGGNYAPPTRKWSAPHYVIYADRPMPTVNPMPPASAISNYNRFILAFWMVLVDGPFDNAVVWANQTDAYRQKILDEYHEAGIALMIAAFGGTDETIVAKADPVATAQKIAAYVKQYGLDGVDIDYEDMESIRTGTAEAWLITFQKELRNQLPEPYIISHAPVAPWFTSGTTYPSGAYVAVHKQVGETISWYNVQFYNQGATTYMDCNSIVQNSGSSWPDTSVMGIHTHTGVPLDKIVIGKPINPISAGSGYMAPELIAPCVAQGKSQGWNGGVMLWQWFPDIANAVMGTIRG